MRCDPLAAANARLLRSTAAHGSHKHGFQNTVVRVQDQYGAGVDDYLLEFYEKDDDTGRIAELFHTSAIRSVHKYSGDPPTGASTSTAPACAAPPTRSATG